MYQILFFERSNPIQKFPLVFIARSISIESWTWPWTLPMWSWLGFHIILCCRSSILCYPIRFLVIVVLKITFHVFYFLLPDDLCICNDISWSHSLLCLINSTKLKPHFLRVNLSTVLYVFTGPHSLSSYSILQFAIIYPLRKFLKSFVSCISYNGFEFEYIAKNYISIT